MPSVFVSLRTRNYRLWAGGQSVSLVGTWMQRVAEDWLVLDLAHGRGWVLGVVMALQFVPQLLLAPYAGVLADRYDRRRVLVLTQGIMALLAAALATAAQAAVEPQRCPRSVARRRAACPPAGPGEPVSAAGARG